MTLKPIPEATLNAVVTLLGVSCPGISGQDLVEAIRQFQRTPNERQESAHPLLSTKEAAEYLNVSKFTVERLIKRGELHGRKAGAQWRLSTKDIRDYLDRTG